MNDKPRLNRNSSLETDHKDSKKKTQKKIRKRVVFIVLALLGLILFVYLISLVGIEPIFQELKKLGWLAPLIFLPYILTLYCDTEGWRQTFVRKNKPKFFSLFSIKLVGDFISNVNPASSFVGDPVRSQLLKSKGFPLIEGLVSVYLARLILAKAQILFVLLGLILGLLAFSKESRILFFMALFLVFITLLLVGIYFLGLKIGLMRVLLSGLRKLRWNPQFLEKRRDSLYLFDDRVKEFYQEYRKNFFLSIVFFFLGWIAGVLELFVFLYLLGSPIGLDEAIFIESAYVAVKAMTFFIPAGIGTQEGTFFILLKTFSGHPQIEQTALAYVLLRRVREILWLMIGFFFLSRFQNQFPKALPDSFKKFKIFGQKKPKQRNLN